MRLLHTSDWHLGRTFHGASLADEQAAAIDALVGIVREAAVDVVVIAGDLYDRQLPPVGAVTLLDAALAELTAAGAQVVAIAGNHDSGPRLDFGGRLLSRAGVHVRGGLGRLGEPVIVPATDGGADLAIYPIPYLEPELARHAVGDPDARTHERVLRAALDLARADLDRRSSGGHRLRSVATAHAFVAGGTPCESERVLSVGGADRVPTGCFAGFDYVALGHLHGPQVLGEGLLRYSGSPVPYSFSERDQPKGAWLVDLGGDGTSRIEWVEVPVRRRLAALSGTIDELLHAPAHAQAERCWVQATLVDQVLPPDAMARLRRRFPHAVVLRHEPPVAPGGGPGYRERVAGRGDLELIGDFVEHVTGQPLDDDEQEVCCAAVTTVRAQEPEVPA